MFNNISLDHVNGLHLLCSCVGFFLIHWLSSIFSPLLFPFYYQYEQYLCRYRAATYLRKRDRPPAVEVLCNSSEEEDAIAREDATSSELSIIPREHIIIQNADWDVHVVALVHALISSIFGLWCYYRIATASPADKVFLNFVSEPYFATNWYTTLLFEISAGYFMYDLIVVVRFYKAYGKSFLLHSLFSILATFTIYLSQVGHGFAVLFLLYELSTPFMNIRWFLSSLDMKDTLLYSINGLVFTITFLLVRIVFGLSFSVKIIINILTMEDPRIKIIRIPFVLSAIILNSLNIFWFSQIYHGFMAHLKRSKIKTL